MTINADVRCKSTRAVVAALATLALAADGIAPAGAEPPAQPTRRCRSGVPGDVNGDGYAELAVGEPGKHQEAGAVHLFYGSPTGIVTNAEGSALDDQYLDEATPGVPGPREAFDRFGLSVRLGDVNGDGCADLVTLTFGASSYPGALVVVYGSPHGLVPTTARRVALRRQAPPDELQLAVADLDGDADDDVAVKVDNAVVVLRGDPAGLDRGAGRTVLTPHSPGMPAAVGPYVGTALATGDFDGDGRAELAVGVLGRFREGAVLTFEDVGGKLVPSRVRSMRSSGAPRAPERYAGFGSVLAAGDVDADGDDDLAVGLAHAFCNATCQHDTEGGGRLADGAVLLLPGSAGGLTTTGSRLWTQDSPGVVGTSQHDGFGYTLAMGRLDVDGTDDLVVGVPFDRRDGTRRTGSVTVLLGSRSGLSTAGAGGERINQETPGIAGASQTQDLFGLALSAARLRGGEQSDLVVGVPFEDVRRRDAGRLVLLPPSASGPQARGSRSLSADSAGVRGPIGRYDNFGASFS